MKIPQIRAASGIARIGVFVAFIAAIAPPAAGQVLYGGVTGTVTDSSGAPVPGATVTITHRETDLSREAVSNETGIYSFTNVQAGTYTLHYELSAGLNGKAKAVGEDGSPVEGEFAVTITDKPARATVGANGEVEIESP